MLCLLMRPLVIATCWVLACYGRRLQGMRIRSHSKLQTSQNHANTTSGALRESNLRKELAILRLAVNPAAGWQAGGAGSGRRLPGHHLTWNLRLAASTRAVRGGASLASAADEDRLRLLRAALDGEGIMEYVVPADEFPGDELEDDGNDPLRLLTAAAAAASAATPPASENSSTRQLAASWRESYFDVDEWADMSPHDVMVADETRNSWFREAIARRLRGTSDHVVLDIGTGPFCLLAFFAARAGARRVYAIEANPVAAEMARKMVDKAEAANLVPAGVVKVVEGSSMDVSLPERADLVVAEIVGEIATAEGIVCTMRDVQERHLKRPHDPSSYIPQRVQTLCAPASYVVPSLLRPPYSNYDFAEDLGEYPMHVGCNNPGVQLLSKPKLLEDLELFRPMPALGSSHTLNLSFIADAGCIAEAKDMYDDVFEESLAMLGCRRKPIRKLTRSLAHSMAGLACWPRLVLDSDPESDAHGIQAAGVNPALVVESRGARVFGAHATTDFHEEPLESHWDMAVPLLSPRPLPVKSGDTVHLRYAVEYGTRIEIPTQYEFQGELVSSSVDPN